MKNKNKVNDLYGCSECGAIHNEMTEVCKLCEKRCELHPVQLDGKAVAQMIRDFDITCRKESVNIAEIYDALSEIAGYRFPWQMFLEGLEQVREDGDIIVRNVAYFSNY
jgi:hypothetical protein